MKLSRVFLFCICVLGATHLAFGQVKEPAARQIPGFLDPATGKFTTRSAATAAAQTNPQATATSTSIFFREDFQIYIANYDQKGTSAICSVDMSSDGDAIGLYYDEQASVAATPVGSGFSCDVPVLTQWLLQTPTMDTISAQITVSIYTPSSQGTSIYLYPVPYRSSTQSLTLGQPANGATAVSSVKFAI